MFFVAAAPKLCIVLSHSIRSSTNIDIFKKLQKAFSFKKAFSII